MHKILLWSGFGMRFEPVLAVLVLRLLVLLRVNQTANDRFAGLAVRFWQLGIEMRPFFNKESLWVYPVYAGVGGSVGYWLMGVEQRQVRFLNQRRESLLEKRRRRAERDGVAVENEAGERISTEGGLVDTVKSMVGSKDGDQEPSHLEETGVRKTGVELTPEEVGRSSTQAKAP